jgi:hypothetical protein
MPSKNRQRWARVSPAIAWKRPGLPAQWTRVLERNPEAMRPGRCQAYVWLETPGKVLHVPAHHLDFQNADDTDGVNG